MSTDHHLTLTNVLKDLFAGSLTGFGICLSGHPFDTIKVRMQMSNDSLSQIIVKSYQQGGIKSFFSGMSSPLTTVPLVNAVVFGSYEFFKKLNGIKDEDEFNFSQGMLAGMFAGFTNSFVVGPIELFKCRLQIQEQQRQFQKQNGLKVQPKMKGPLDVLRHIYLTEGIIGIFKGQIITQLREIACYAAQFASYEYGKNLVQEKYQLQQITSFQAFLLGGMSGIMCWIFSYPQDIIKTKLQCDIEGVYKIRNLKIMNDGGIINCCQQMIKKQGLFSFWQGFSACLIRAFYANSVGFLIYEESRQILFPKNNTKDN